MTEQIQTTVTFNAETLYEVDVYLAQLRRSGVSKNRSEMIDEALLEYLNRRDGDEPAPVSAGKE